jgi:hypothetical protein
MVESSLVAVPRNSFCEHALSKSRVLVLLSRAGRRESVQAVLTCADPDVAEEVAVLLRSMIGGGRGPAVQAEADRLAGLLPDAVAASLRQAVEWVYAGGWPVPEHAHRIVVPPPDESLLTSVVDESRRTPSEARLADLSGPVVRVVRLVELHVHDPERLRTAAMAAGWPPAEEDENDDDPRDVLGAAMALTDELPAVPGADVVNEESIGEVLVASRGDELAEWSTDSVIANFGTGWRARRADAEPQPARPDFVALFPVGDDKESWYLTPRTADSLHSALCMLADEIYDDVEEHGDEPITSRDGEQWMALDRLPHITWRQDAQWRRNIARAADDLAADLERGDWPLPRCTGEEMVLHLAIRDADGFTDDQDEDLPHHPDDNDWDLCSEMLFQDQDVLLLEEGSADGIEHPNEELNQLHGIGDLRPANWFTTFNNAKPRPADRGYRR